MFSVKRDFGVVGKLFGIPRDWLSRVGAFCSSWMVEGNFLTLVVPEFPDPVKNPIRLGINKEAVAELLGEPNMGTPVDIRDSAVSDGTDQSPVTWQAGGANGIQLSAYVKCEKDGASYWYRANIDISADGRIKKVDFPGSYREL